MKTKSLHQMTHRRGPSSVDVSQKRDIKKKKRESDKKLSLCGNANDEFPLAHFTVVVDALHTLHSRVPGPFLKGDGLKKYARCECVCWSRRRRRAKRKLSRANARRVAVFFLEKGAPPVLGVTTLPAAPSPKPDSKNPTKPLVRELIGTFPF